MSRETAPRLLTYDARALASCPASPRQRSVWSIALLPPPVSKQRQPLSRVCSSFDPIPLHGVDIYSNGLPRLSVTGACSPQALFTT